jgi:hypothetical protein
MAELTRDEKRYHGVILVQSCTPRDHWVTCWHARALPRADDHVCRLFLPTLLALDQTFLATRLARGLTYNGFDEGGIVSSEADGEGDATQSLIETMYAPPPCIPAHGPSLCPAAITFL